MINNDIIGNHHKRQVHVLVADHLVYKHTDLHVEQLKTISKCGTSTPYWVVCSQLADNLCKRQFHAKHMFFLPTFIQIGLAKIAKNQGSNNEPPLYLLIKKSTRIHDNNEVKRYCSVPKTHGLPFSMDLKSQPCRSFQKAICSKSKT